jgi:hypothetical protein
MKSVSKKVTILFGISTIAFSFVGCSQNTKVAECNKMVKVVNKAAKLGEEFFAASKTNDQTKSVQLMATTSDKIIQSANEMKTLEIKDEKLKGFQSRFINVYEGVGTGVRDAGISIKKKDQAQLKTAMDKIFSSSKPEKELINEARIYCTGK